MYNRVHTFFFDNIDHIIIIIKIRLFGVYVYNIGEIPVK